MDQCWNGQFYQISIRGPDCDTAPDPVADSRENDGRLWLWWGTKENERLRTQDWIQKKMNGRLRTLRRIRRKWTAPDPDWRIRRSNDTEAGLLVSFALKRSASYLLHSEIGSRASSKKRFYFLESQQFRIFSRNRSLLIRTKNRAT